MVEFPLASVAVQVTVVSPTGKVAGASLVMLGAGSTRSLAVTMDTYSHVLPGMQEEAALAVENLLNRFG